MISFILAAFIATEAAPPAVSPAALPNGTPSLQSQFDGATVDHDAGRFAQAVKAYEALERLPKIQKNAGVLSVVLMRKGGDLVQLGQVEEGEAALRAGLKIVPVDRPDLRNDRFVAEHALSLISMDRLDYAAAAEQAAKALAIADDDINKAVALITMARATTFDPGDAAVRYADQALQIVGAKPDTSKEGKKGLASIQTIRARALLNHAKAAEAYAVLKTAISGQGGLDLKVDVNEIITRSDIAIAALLSGKPEEARKYLAYTGAGRIAEAPFRLAARMDIPPCGGPANLQPQDAAVIEFSIDVDGSVAAARPIYASVNGPAATEFARTVAGWSWRREDVAKIPPLFRAVTRVELSCSTSATRPPLGQLLGADLTEWLKAAHANAAPDVGTDAHALLPLQAELARRDAAGGVWR